jgi:hypothetical protein
MSEHDGEIEQVRQRISRALWGIQAPLEGLGHTHTRIDANSAEFITQTVLDALSLERVHPDGQEEVDPEAHWCAAHSEGQRCCADAPDVWRLRLEYALPDCRGFQTVDCRCSVRDIEPPLAAGDLVIHEGERYTVLGFRAHGRLLDIQRRPTSQVLCVPRAPYGVPFANVGNA